MQLTNPSQYRFHPDEESTALLSVAWQREGTRVFLETMVFNVDVDTGEVDWSGAMRHVSIPPPYINVQDANVLKLCQTFEFLAAKAALPYRRNAGITECCKRIYQALEQEHA